MRDRRGAVGLSLSNHPLHCDDTAILPLSHVYLLSPAAGWAVSRLRRAPFLRTRNVLKGPRTISSPSLRPESASTSMAPEIPVATVTIERTVNTDIWTQPEKIAERAVYLSRLVTARNFSGLQIGNALIDWACDHAASEYAAEWIRIDVWTRNRALHRYYRQRGFAWCGLCPDKNYPSRARFQRPTSIRTKDKPLLTTRSSTFRQPIKSRIGIRGYR